MLGRVPMDISLAFVLGLVQFVFSSVLSSPDAGAEPDVAVFGDAVTTHQRLVH